MLAAICATSLELTLNAPFIWRLGSAFGEDGALAQPGPQGVGGDLQGMGEAARGISHCRRRLETIGTGAIFNDQRADLREGLVLFDDRNMAFIQLGRHAGGCNCGDGSCGRTQNGQQKHGVTHLISPPSRTGLTGHVVCMGRL